MSEWKKFPAEERESAEETVATPAEALAAEETSAPPRRHHRRKSAAIIGFLTILMALFGVVSLVIFMVLGIHVQQEKLLDEVGYFISPLTAFTPEAFSDVNESDQDALLLSAIYRVTVEEQIRQMQENTAECQYELDDMGRMLVPIEEIEEAYLGLYGKEAVPYHHTIGEEGLSYTYSYDKENGVYHIPQDAGNSMYYIVYGRLTNWFGTIRLEVGYVPGSLGIDDRGQTIEPTIEDARVVQIYKLKESEDGYYIVSVSDVKK